MEFRAVSEAREGNYNQYIYYLMAFRYTHVLEIKCKIEYILYLVELVIDYKFKYFLF